MKLMESSLIFQPLFLFALFGNIFQIYGLSLCPPKNRIAPCTCTQYGKIQIICEGGDKKDDDKITSQLLANIISSLRDVNNVSADSNEWLYLPEFHLTEVPRSTLDLSPFVKVKFSHFQIKFCGLTKLFGPGEQFYALIDVENLDLSFNSLTDDGLGDALKYFKSDSLKTIKLNNNKIQLQQDLQGLSSFNNLQVLMLNNNEITRVGGGQFKSNKNLRDLFLHNNKIREIGNNAFELGIPDSLLNSGSGFEGELLIELSGNELTDANISSAHGLSWTFRSTNVRFNHNNFTYISAENFESYLTHGKYFCKLDFGGNRINCADERMQWLTNLSETLEFGKIKGIPCLIPPETHGKYTSFMSASSQAVVGNLNPFRFCALFYAMVFFIQ